MADVFLSYSRKTSGFALHIKDILDNIGINVWIDQSDIRGGDRWEEKINQALKECKLLIVIVSPAAITSEWVEYEWKTALSAGKPIIPLYYYEVENEPDELFANNYIDFRDKFRVERLIYDVSTKLGLTSRIIPDTAPPHIQKMLQTLIGGWNPDEKKRALELLGQEKYEDAVPIIGAVIVEDSDWQVRIEAAKAFAEIGSKAAIPYMKKALVDQNKSVRNAVVKRLGMIGGELVVEDIASMLDDEEQIVSQATVKTLILIGNEEAAKYVLEWYIEAKRNDANPYSLGELEQLGHAAVAPLVILLNDSDSHVRQTAVSLFHNFRYDAAVEPLVECIQNGDDEMRVRGLNSLTAVNPEEAIPYLLNALKDQEWRIREVGASMLGYATVESGGVTNSLEMIHAVQLMLTDSVERVRNAAQRSLRKIGTPEAFQALHDAGFDEEEK